MFRSPKSSQAGFSLLEIIIAVSVLAILAGVISMRSGVVLDNAKATKVTEIVESLKTACAAYHADTGDFPREVSQGSSTARDLTSEQSSAGWNGPYLESPLGRSGTNPYGGRIDLYNSVTTGSWVTGFDTDGDGTEDVTGSACMLRLDSVLPDEAERVDQILDSGVPGTWEDSGRVRYVSGSSRLLILTYF